MAAIEAHQLTRHFGKLVAVENLDLEVAQGEVMGFLGPNGAGKTTTIRMLSGMIAPTSGYARVAGIRTDDPVEKLHEVIGLLTESPGFYNRLSASRNLEYFAGFYSQNDMPSRIESYLKIMGLWERRNDPVGTFSKGMKQRLALARALLPGPQVLFLDEPTSGLDPEAAEEVRGLIKKLSGEGRTIFLSTHNLTEAEQLCHRIAIFRNHLLALNTPERLRRQLFQRRVSIRLDKFNEAISEALKKLAAVKFFEHQENQLSLSVDNLEKDLPGIIQTIVFAGGGVLEVKEEEHSLEEIYLILIREEDKA